MPFLRPDADVSDGGFTTQAGGSSLFAVLDESSQDDADYVISSADPDGDAFKVAFEGPSGAPSALTVRSRFRKRGPATANVIARLLQDNYPTTWNPSDIVDATLTNGNLTVTSTGGYGGVRSIASLASELVYVEIILTTISPDTLLVGLSNSALNLDIHYPGFNLDGIGWYQDGNAYINNSSVGTISPAWTQGDTLCMAIRPSDEKMWFRINGGNWNNDVIGNQNPATNTGGTSYSTLNAGPYFITAGFIILAPPQVEITANFGLTAYDQARPSGFHNLGDSELEVASWEYLDIADTFTTEAETLTAPQLALITDANDLRGEFEVSVVAAVTTTTLNPFDKSSEITLSNGDLTALGIQDATNDWREVRSIASASTGKKHWEVTVDNLHPALDGSIGIATAAVDLDVWPGASVGSLIWNCGTGDIYRNGSDIGTIQTYAEGDILSVAADFGAELIWFRTNGGNWNNSATANPATGTEGISFSTLTGPYYALIGTVHSLGEQYTCNFGATAYAHSVPSGFGNLEVSGASYLYLDEDHIPGSQPSPFNFTMDIGTAAADRFILIPWWLGTTGVTPTVVCNGVTLTELHKHDNTGYTAYMHGGIVASGSGNQTISISGSFDYHFVCPNLYALFGLNSTTPKQVGEGAFTDIISVDTGDFVFAMARATGAGSCDFSASTEAPDAMHVNSAAGNIASADWTINAAKVSFTIDQANGTGAENLVIVSFA